MQSSDTPKDGDFASFAEKTQSRSGRADRGITDADEREYPSSPALPRRQTVEDVIVGGEEATEEFLEAWHAFQNAPELSDEELAKQALSAPGDDGEPTTPE